MINATIDVPTKADHYSHRFPITPEIMQKSSSICPVWDGEDFFKRIHKYIIAMLGSMTEFKGTIGRTWEDSKPWWPQPIRAPSDAPDHIRRCRVWMVELLWWPYRYTESGQTCSKWVMI